MLLFLLVGVIVTQAVNANITSLPTTSITAATTPDVTQAAYANTTSTGITNTVTATTPDGTQAFSPNTTSIGITNTITATTPDVTQVVNAKTTSIGITNTTRATTSVTDQTQMCDPSTQLIQAVYQFTNTTKFRDLTDSQQIFVFELLATAEVCKLSEFLDVQTAQRIFLLTADLPMKYVYTFISFLSKSLDAEGVVVPV